MVKIKFEVKKRPTFQEMNKFAPYWLLKCSECERKIIVSYLTLGVEHQFPQGATCLKCIDVEKSKNYLDHYPKLKRAVMKEKRR